MTSNSINRQRIFLTSFLRHLLQWIRTRNEKKEKHEYHDASLPNVSEVQERLSNSIITSENSSRETSFNFEIQLVALKQEDLMSAFDQLLSDRS